MSISVKLKKIADVSMGHSFRARLEPDSDGNVLVVQMRDLTQDNHLNTENLARVSAPEAGERHYIKRGDIVFRSRGQTNTAVLVDQNMANAVVAAPLLRIRTRESVVPEYLYWYLNLPSSQAWFEAHARGTAVKMISKQMLDYFEIIVPPIEMQRNVAQLSSLVVDEQRLMRQLADKRKQYMDGILMQMASESQ